MARKPRTTASHDGIPLQRPDAAAQMDATLRRLAGEKSLFEQAAQRQRELDRERGGRTRGDNDDDDDDDDDDNSSSDNPPSISPRAERLLDTLLWAVSLTMLHVTLDVLVQNQYAMALEWRAVAAHAGPAFAVFCLLVYALHHHPSDPRLVPGRLVPARAQAPLRQAVFFVGGTLAGCYLTHIANTYSYLAVMGQAPAVGCVWVWAVVELELAWAVASLAVTGGFMKAMGYGL